MRPVVWYRYPVRVWTLLVLWLLPAVALAADPLTLQEVLRSVSGTHPDLEVAELGVDKAEAKAFAARGGFDPILAIKGKYTPVGYYTNGQVDTLVRQPTPFWGAGLYAGYRIGLGSYPVYRGELQTLSGGEVRAGIDVPIWRDGPIDDRRAKIRRAKIERNAAQFSRDAAELDLQREAAKSYWSWVAAGLRLRVARELLAIAERRDAGLNEQATEGAIENIQLVDNRRLVLDRMGKVVSAEREFNEASLALSLFLRDDDRNPVRMGEERVPADLPEPIRVDVPSLEREVQRAMNVRPDVAALDASREAANVDVRLARNQRAPKVNLQTFVAKDLGDGPVELGPIEWGAGIVVEMPLPLRQARGDLRAAQADRSSVDAKRRGLRDKVGVDVRKAIVALEAAEQNIVLARRQVAAADELAAAERTKLIEGASELVIVNLRELAAADAANQEIDALADFHRAHADFMASTGRLPAS